MKALTFKVAACALSTANPYHLTCTRTRRNGGDGGFDIYEAFPERPKTRHSTPKSAPDFDLKLFKTQGEPPKNMVVGGSTLCICGSQPPYWVLDSGALAHDAIGDKGGGFGDGGSKISRRLRRQFAPNKNWAPSAP